MLNKSLLAISMLTLVGCNTVLVNETEDKVEFPTETNEVTTETPEIEVITKAPEINGFECYQILDNDEKHPILLITSPEDPDIGSVVFSDNIVQPAQYAVRGLERHWSFGCDDKSCKYRIDLQVSGLAHYYDFTHKDEVESSLTLFCK